MAKIKNKNQGGRFAGTHKIDKNAAVKAKRGPIDVTYLAIAAALLIIGLIALYSSSYAFSYNKYNGDAHRIIREQMLFFAIGVFGMVVVSFINHKFWQQFSYVVMVLALFLLVVVLFTEGYNNSKRWLVLPFKIGTIQPSEIAKFAVILMFANLIDIHKDKIKTIKYGITPFFLILFVVSGLLILEPHLSCTLLILGIGFSMMYAGGSDIRFLALTLLVGGGALVLALLLFPDQIPYISPRIQTWRDPLNSPYLGAYQVKQSLITVGSGGLFGRGIGKSAQKFAFLPEMHNDYIFAVWCEEMGFVGAIILVALFLMLFFRGLFIAARTEDRFGKMMVLGINIQIALQAFLHMAVNINLIPSTGISLPFFSSGGTSLVMLMGEIGIVIAVSRSADLKGEKALIGDKASSEYDDKAENENLTEAEDGTY